MKFGYADVFGIGACWLLLACTQAQVVASAEWARSPLIQALGLTLAAQSALESATWDGGDDLDSVSRIHS